MCESEHGHHKDSQKLRLNTQAQTKHEEGVTASAKPTLHYYLDPLFCGLFGFSLIGSGTGEHELHRMIPLMTRIFVHRTLERSHRNLSRPRFRVDGRVTNRELIEEYGRGGPRGALDNAP